MLSGEGNKNSGFNQQKKRLCMCSTLFLYISLLLSQFAQQQRETSRTFLVARFMKKCHVCSCSLFFSLPLIFTQLSDLQYFSFSHCCCKIFMLFFQQKMSPLLFISCSIQLSVVLFLVEFRWPVSYFLFLYIPNLWS